MRFSSVPKRVWILLLLLMLVAGIFRYAALQYAPAGGHGDVSWVGINALDWIDRGVWPFYVRELYSPEFFPVYLTGLLIPFTGISHLPQRLITATSGMLMVPALFWAVWWLLAELNDPRRWWSALAAAAAAAFSIHAVFLSRLGMESPPFILTVTLFVGATAWAWQRGGLWRWALAGFLLGLNQYIYLPARLLPVVMFLWLGFLLLTQHARLRRQLKGIILMGVISLLVTLPAIILFIQAPFSFSGRADLGSQETGGWVWLFDTTEYGGIAGLILQKLWLTIRGIGIYWGGEYTLMGQPMLSPLFFAGFIAAFLLTFRYWKSIAFGWCWLAIAPLIITDLISGGVPRIHALHQMGILPFIFILSGLGLGFSLYWLYARIKSRWAKLVLMTTIALAALMPSAIVFARYLNEYTPQQYSDPNFYWSEAQADLDIAAYLNAHSERTYLVPLSEYTRPDFAWFVSQGFRQRQSAIGTDGQLALPSLPEAITVVMPDDPERPRHDGHLARFAPNQWVLLHDNTIYLLPMLDQETVQALTAAIDNSDAVEHLSDRSGTEIARLMTIDRPDDLNTPSPVIQHPVDATFDDMIKLVGYSTSSQDIEPGSIVELTLYFQVLQPVPEDYEVFAQLWDDSQNVIAQSQEFPYSGMYRSRIWQTGEIVPVHLWMRIPDDLAHGRYTLAVGLFRYLQRERLPVNGVNTLVDEHVAIAPDFRYPLPLISLPVIPENAPTANFNDLLQVTLASAQANNEPLTGTEWSIPAGSSIQLELAWQALAHPVQDFSIFLHFAPEDELEPLAQSDDLIRPDYPTGAWRSGDQILDSAILEIPADIPPGRYDVVAGVYNWQTGERLPVIDGNTLLPENRIRLGQVQITSP